MLKDYSYHILNRGVGRMRLFEDARDFWSLKRYIDWRASQIPGGEVVQLLRDAEPLAFDRLAQAGVRPGVVGVDALGGDDARAAVTSASPHARRRTRVSGPIQEFSDPGR